MRKITYIYKVLLAAMMVATSSCSEDTPGEDSSTGTRAMSVIIDNSGGPENREQIKTLRLVVFDKASSANPALDVNKVFPIDGGPGQGTGIIVTEFEVNVGNDKMVAAVVNEPAGMSQQLAAIRQPWELEAVTYNLVDVVNQSGNGDGTTSLPMTGVVRNVTVTQANDITHPKEITMSIERIMSRVDIYFRVDGAGEITLAPGTSSVVLSNTALSGYFAAGTETDGTRDWSIPPAASNLGFLQTVPVANLEEDTWAPTTSTTINEADGTVFIKTFYTAERTCYAAADADKLTLDFRWISSNAASVKYVLKEAIRQGETTPEVIDIVKRNSMYKITAVIDAGKIRFEHEIVPWTNKDVGGIIDPQFYLRVSGDNFIVRNSKPTVSLRAETNYTLDDRGFPKGLIVNIDDIKYYDRYGDPVIDSGSSKYGWLNVSGGQNGDLIRNLTLKLNRTMLPADGDCYATVEIKAGNLIKMVKVLFERPSN